MSILSVLHFPDSRLRTVAEPVEQVDRVVRKLIDDLLETMYDAPGIGLAATQVDVHRRVLVIDISEDKNMPHCFVNPEILEKEGVEKIEEGCLSIPGIYEPVERANRIVVKALDKDGKSFELEVEGVLSVCIQHEIDHLEGKLFVDYLSEMKRNRIRKKMEKLKQKEM